MRHLLLLNVLVFAGCGRMGFAPAQSNGQSDVDADTNADGPGDRAADASIDAAPDADLRILGPGVWATTPASPVPARFWTSGVWTGTEFVVVGGALDNPGYNATATGARYNPSTKQWNTTSETNA
ncbi:MAG TPA: hypothetical protein PLF40_27100, partial [Kofleriaceae bacterium]|nr:hypothetical protein [Kofleriaceae bacterium]